MMKKPNFFILGAPKCGTTSLSSWLSTHERVCFCRTKEPHFFNFDYGVRITRSLKTYESLFNHCNDSHYAIGEASVHYLFSRTAVPAILEYTDNTRFIVMIRNPVDMAYSLHEQHIYNGFEDIDNFMTAWSYQSYRRYGDKVSKNCPDPRLLIYGDVCKLGDQIERLYNYADDDRILIINLDDLKNDPRNEYIRALNFLGLNYDGRSEFNAENTAKKLRYPWISNGTRKVNRLLREIGFPHIRLGITEFIYKHNRKLINRPPLTMRSRKILIDYFYDDICKLENITGLNLSSWKDAENNS